MEAAGVQGIVWRKRRADDVSVETVEKLEAGSLLPATRTARRAEPVYRRLFQSRRRGIRARGTYNQNPVAWPEKKFSSGENVDMAGEDVENEKLMMYPVTGEGCQPERVVINAVFLAVSGSRC